ncbi:Scr1 family TA system antitoxin-like transcriptional regulator [Actinomadura sp. NPDC000600]|uniref:Scr1 family TA system antitoxin-like transcriptional regulator n=1 Tax=Actinomadura sp. NPDC000600 TaxID=3154262 RepID=UPI003394B0D2
MGRLSPRVGGREVMREQVAHLIRLSEHPSVILRIVPNVAGANEGLDGPFKASRSRKGRSVSLRRRTGADWSWTPRRSWASATGSATSVPQRYPWRCPGRYSRTQ